MIQKARLQDDRLAAPEDREHDAEHQEAEERSSPSGRIVYKAILKEGRDELERPSSALFWSGLAAGLSMGFSLIAEGLLKAHLPAESWTVLVSKLGYSLGFLVVILGRQQLFTENTLTPILPLLQERSMKALGNVARLWSIVLVANLLGTFALSWVVAQTSAFDGPVKGAFAAIGHEALKDGFGTALLKAIFAGWLIALMVWLLPFAEVGRVWVIIILAYVVGIGRFNHVIAGAVETFTVAAMGQKSWAVVVGDWLIPTLIGNIIGGVMLVAALNHAQVCAGKGGEDM